MNSFIDRLNYEKESRDNPNVNKAIEKLIDAEVRREREKYSMKANKNFDLGLIRIGSCPLHLIHNSFKNAIESNDWQVKEFLSDLFRWFNRSPSRRDDYIKVCKYIPGRFIRRFVITRWLEIGPILTRVIQQWTNLREYFLLFIPSEDKTLTNNSRYIQIRNFLQSKLTLIRLKLLVFVYQNIYEPILLWFQQSQTLIHLLHDQCEQLIRRLFSSFVKEDLIENQNLNELIRIDFQLEENQKVDSMLQIGESTRDELGELSKREISSFFCEVRTTYCEISRELLRTLPLKNEILRHLKCLNPSMREFETSKVSIINVARYFPQILRNDEIDRVGNEWSIYRNEEIPKDWLNKNGSIEEFWRKIFSLKSENGTRKFVFLSKLIKSALALSHGNADAERGFSENSFLLSDDRSLLSDASINGLRATRDAIKYFADGKTHQVPITIELLDTVVQAHSRYNVELEKRRENLSTESIDEKKNEIFQRQDLLHKNLSNVQKLLDKGAERLAKAISTKNFSDVEAAQWLIEDGNEKLALANTKLVENDFQLKEMRRNCKF